MATHYKDLRDMLENIEKQYSNEVAFKIKYKSTIVEVKYSKFIEDVKNFGSYLLSLDLKSKRVAIISSNRYEWCVAYMATATSDLTVVPLDKSLTENEFHSLIERSKSDVIIYENKYQEFIDNEKANPKTSVKKFIDMDIEMNSCYDGGKVLLLKKNAQYNRVKIINDKMRFMIFTSGTTAMSKCVMLSHRNICTNIEQIDDRLDVTKDDTLLSFLPIHHTFECTAGFLYPISKGASIAFCEGLRHIANNLKEFGVTAMISVPALYETMYKKMWKAIIDNKKETQVKVALKASEALLKVGIDMRKQLFKPMIESIGGKARLFVSGAAGINQDVLKGFNDFGIPLYQGYGLTETSPVVSVENSEWSRLGSVGKPLNKVEIKIEEPNEEGIGEILIKSPIVMIGYYENEEVTKNAFSHGWLKTGDLGRMDSDGYLYITGRKKDVIVLKNGKNIFPEELESLVNNMDCVKESIVYGSKMEDNDLELRAKIVYDKDAVIEKYGILQDEELKEIFWNLIKETNKTMPTYKYIKKIMVTDEPLIKTTTNKVKRHEEIKKIIEEELKGVNNP